MPRSTPANAMQCRSNNELEAQVTSLQQENLALRHTEERFRALFEQAAEYLLILEPGADGILVIVDLNEATCQIHGYSREELLGQPITFLDSAETRKNVPERARQVMSGKAHTFEAVHTRKDGSTITVEGRYRRSWLPASSTSMPLSRTSPPANRPKPYSATTSGHRHLPGAYLVGGSQLCLSGGE